MKIGPYEILGELGRGGMGIVYRARHAELGHAVALKVIAPELAANRTAAARLWVALELVEGATLEAVASAEALTPRTAAVLIRDAARAVAAAHARGVLHRDLKPANILLDGYDRARPLDAQVDTVRVRVTDFGLAALVVPDAALTRLTRSDMLIGTPAYMPPEQGRGADVGPASDVFALGATLFELLAGRPPRGSQGTLALVTELLFEPPPALANVAPETPPTLAAIVDRCCEFDPVDRYTSAAALADDLDAYLEGRPTQAQPLSGRARTLRWAHRRRRGLAATVVAVLAVAGAAGGLAWWGTRARQRADAMARRADDPRRPEAGASLAAAFQALRVATAADLRLLEDHLHGAEVGADAVARALARVGEAADRIAREHPEARSPAAWRELAAFCAGDVDAAHRVDRLARSSTGDPFAALAHVRVWLHAYALATKPPHGDWYAHRVDRRTWAETPLQATARRQLGAAVRAAAARDPWRAIPDLEGYRRCAAAGVLLADGRFAEAARAFEAVRDDPDLGGSALFLAGLCHLAAGEPETAAQLLEHVGARGWVRAQAEAASAWMVLGVHRRDDPEASIAAYARAAELGERMVRASKPLADAHNMAALALLGIARCERGLGRDPTGTAARAIALLEAARADPVDETAILGNLVEMRVFVAQHRLQAGGDAEGPLRAALAECNEALALGPDATWILSKRGMVHMLLAQVAQLRGSTDAEPWVRAAIADQERVATLDPESQTAHNGLGLAHHRMAVTAGDRREDPRPWLQRAIAAYDRALAIDPEYGIVRFNRATARIDLAEAMHLGGEDPRAEFAGALEDLDAAHRLLAEDTAVGLARANCLRAMGEHLMTTGGDPTEAFRRADAELTTLAERGAPNSAVWHMLGLIVFLQGQYAQRHGDAGASAHHARAVECFDRALALNSTSWRSHATRADALCALGRLDDALAAFDRALALFRDRALAARRAQVAAALGK